jgi:energy-coupling factor transporter transmembrane protein EcfT
LALGILLPIVVYKYLPQYTALTIPFVIIFLIGGIAMLRFLRYARVLPFLFILIFVIFLTFNTGTVRAIPVLNQYKSAKEICDKANSIMKPHEKLAMYNFFRDPYLFYTDRNHIEIISDLDNLRQFLNSDERVFLFIQEKDFSEISKLPEIPVFVLGRDSVGHRTILFVSNRDI